MSEIHITHLCFQLPNVLTSPQHRNNNNIFVRLVGGAAGFDSCQGLTLACVAVNLTRPVFSCSIIHCSVQDLKAVGRPRASKTGH